MQNGYALVTLGPRCAVPCGFVTGLSAEHASASDIVAYGQPCRWVVMGLPGGQRHVAGRRCVATASAPWPRSALVIRSRPVGPIRTGRNRFYAVTARGTESDIGDTILLITFLILIVASMLLGQILVRRRWSASVRW